jgi:DNA-directed RNA polymerase subunit H (RpoH/RPB5)
MAEDPCVVVYRTLAEFATVRGYKLTEKNTLQKYDFQVKLNQDGYYSDFENLIKTLERSVDKNYEIEEVILITNPETSVKTTILKIVNRFIVAASKQTVTKDNYKPLSKYYNLYRYSLFYINILRHVAAGNSYHILSSDEKREVIEYHRKKKTEFPRLLPGTSVIPWIGARPGDIVRVKIYSAPAGYEIKYLMI